MNEEQKKEMEMEVEILCSEMIAFEEMTKPEDKAQKRPEIIVRILQDAILRTLKSQQERLVGEIEKLDISIGKKSTDEVLITIGSVLEIIKKTYGQKPL